MTLIHSIISCTLLLLLCSGNGAIIIQNYPDLPVEYEERITEFSLRNQIDPYKGKSIEDLEKICKLMETSKMFLMANKGQIAAESVQYPKNSSDDELNKFDSKAYQRMSIKIRPDSERELEVNIFPCSHKINDEYWYFSYGFVGDFMYVFKKKELTVAATEMEFLGLAERTPVLDPSFMLDNRESERYFINVMARRRSQIPPPLKEEPLCWLNANQQFRLCSQVAGALHRDKIMESNYETYHVHNCKKVNLFLREIYENGGAYPTGNVIVNTISCGNQSSPHFSVVLDPRGENSAFVIRNSVEIIKLKKGQRQFIDVVGHVSNVSVLEYAKIFY